MKLLIKIDSEQSKHNQYLDSKSPSMRQRLPNKRILYQTWEANFWVACPDCPRGSQHMQPITIALDCFLEVEVESLLLKTSYTSHTGPTASWVRMDLNA